MRDKHFMKRLVAECNDEKRHYKLYKHGKLWAVAGISVIFAGALSFQLPETTQAVTNTDVKESAQSGATLKQNPTAQLLSKTNTAFASSAAHITARQQQASTADQVLPSSTGRVRDSTVAPTQKKVSLTVKYVNDAEDGAQVGNLETITGDEGSSGTYRVTVPGYLDLANGQASVVSYKLTSDDTDNITIHLTHPIDHLTRTTTRKITYEDDKGNQIGDPVIQTVKWNVSKDRTLNTSVYTPQSSGYAAVPVTPPTGFTVKPDKYKDGVPAESFKPNTIGLPSENEPITVRFTPDKVPVTATATVKFVDDDASGATVATDTIEGFVGDKGTYQAPNRLAGLLVNYNIVNDKPGNLDYTLAGDDSDNITIHLTHMHYNQLKYYSTREITYSYEDGTRAALPVVQKIEWKGSLDMVTGERTYTPWKSGYEAVTKKAPSGFTVDSKTVSTVSYEQVPKTVTISSDTDFPHSQLVEVVFKADKASAKVTYVDDADGVSVDTDTIDGHLGDTGTYDAANYVANSPKLTEYTFGKLPSDKKKPAKIQPSKVQYTLTSDDSDNLVIHLTHRIDHISGPTQRTITYLDEAGNSLKDPVVQNIMWYASRDRVTGKSIYTPIPLGYPAVPSPEIVGLFADKPTVTAEVENANTKGLPVPETVKVVYHDKAETAKVIYVDDAQGDNEVKVDTITGHFGDKGNYLVKVPTHYSLAKGQLAKLPYTLTDGLDDNLIVHLTHQVADTTVETKRTIHYVFENGRQASPDKVQIIKWGVSKDLVTGQSVAKAPTSYLEVTSPSIAGYSANPTVVKQEAPDPTSDLSQLKDETVTVKYVANAAELSVTYIERGLPDRVIKNEVLTGKVGDTGEYLPLVPQGYEAVNFTPGKGIEYTLTPGANGITLYLKRVKDDDTPGGNTTSGGGTTPSGNTNPGGGTNPGGNTNPGGSPITGGGQPGESNQNTGNSTNTGLTPNSNTGETTSPAGPVNGPATNRPTLPDTDGEPILQATSPAGPVNGPATNRPTLPDTDGEPIGQASVTAASVNGSEKNRPTLPETGNESAVGVALLGVSLLSLFGLIARKRKADR